MDNLKASHTNSELFKRLAIRILITIVIGLFIFYGIPIFFQFLYPFIFAFILAAAANPLVNQIDKWLVKLKVKSSVSRGIVTFLLTILILLSIVFVIYVVLSTLLQEIFGLATSIQENWSAIVEMFEEAERWLTVQMDILPPEAIEIIEGVTENLLDFIRNFSRNLLNHTVTITGFVISKAGSVTLNTLTFFLSLYFLMSDFDRLKTYIKQRTDKNILNTLYLLKDTTILGVGGYIKTQLILALLAFIVMFISFTLYGLDYALTIAIFLAIIDIIPLIGTIVILLPWGLYELFLGIPNFGVFLIILGIGYFLMRRLVEPKIMGTQTGLHPLFALIGIYVGIQFSGLWGALLGPLVMVVVIGIIRSGILDNTFADISELYYKVAYTLKRSKI